MPDLEALAVPGEGEVYVDGNAVNGTPPGERIPYQVKVKEGVRLKARSTRKRTVHRNLFGVPRAKCPIAYNRGSSNNILHSLLKRSCRDNGKQPDLSFCYRPEIQCHNESADYTEEACEKYLASTGWPSSKKETWRQKIYPVLPGLRMSWDLASGKDHDVFIKNEVYPNAKYPRAIQNTQPVLKAIQALNLWLYNKQFFSLPYFPKHLDHKGRVQRMKQISRKYFYGTDFTSFESSICRGAQKLERKYFNLMMPPEVEHIDSKLASGLIPSVRMSGDYQTSLGNSIVNYSLNATFLDQAIGAGHWDILVEGDDAFVTTDFPVDCEQWQQFMSRLGFVLKVTTGPTAGSIGFCELHFNEYGSFHSYVSLIHKGLIGPYRPAISVQQLKQARIFSWHLECPGSYLFQQMAKHYSAGITSIDDNAYELEHAPGPVIKRGSGEAYCNVGAVRALDGDTDVLYGISRVMVDELVKMPLDKTIKILLDFLDFIDLEEPLSGPYWRFSREVTAHARFVGPLGVSVDGCNVYDPPDSEVLYFGGPHSDPGMPNPTTSKPKQASRTPRPKRRAMRQTLVPVKRNAPRNFRPRLNPFWRRFRASVPRLRFREGILPGRELIATLKCGPGGATGSDNKMTYLLDPATWTAFGKNTRTKNIASTFMAVHIDHIEVQWVPSAAVTESATVYMGVFRCDDFQVTPGGILSATSKISTPVWKPASMVMSKSYLPTIDYEFRQNNLAQFPVLVVLVDGAKDSTTVAGNVVISYRFRWSAPAQQPLNYRRVRVPFAALNSEQTKGGVPLMGFVLGEDDDDEDAVTLRHNNYMKAGFDWHKGFSALIKLGKLFVASLEPTSVLKVVIDGISTIISAMKSDNAMIRNANTWDVQTDTIVDDDAAMIRAPDENYIKCVVKINVTSSDVVGDPILHKELDLFDENEEFQFANVTYSSPSAFVTQTLNSSIKAYGFTGSTTAVNKYNPTTTSGFLSVAAGDICVFKMKKDYMRLYWGFGELEEISELQRTFILLPYIGGIHSWGTYSASSAARYITTTKALIRADGTAYFAKVITQQDFDFLYPNEEETVKNRFLPKNSYSAFIPVTTVSTNVTTDFPTTDVFNFALDYSGSSVNYVPIWYTQAFTGHDATTMSTSLWGSSPYLATTSNVGNTIPGDDSSNGLLFRNHAPIIALCDCTAAQQSWLHEWMISHGIPPSYFVFRSKNRAVPPVPRELPSESDESESDGASAGRHRLRLHRD